MMTLLAMVFTACEDDYSAPAAPQSNPQESALQSSAITFSAADIATLNLNELIAEDAPISLGTVTVDGNLPANTILKATIEMSKQATFNDSIIVEAEDMTESNTIGVLPSNLQAAYFNNYTHNPNSTTIYLRIILSTLTGGKSEAFIGTPGTADFYKGNYTITFIPVNENGRYISTGYYAVAKGLDNNWIETKFDHSDIDVYDDPVFTDSVMAIKDANDSRVDTEFYIVAEEDLAAFKAGDKSVAFGKGEGEALLKGGPAFVGPASDNAFKYKLTMNMEKQTVVITPDIKFYYYYLFGVFNMKPADGESAKNYAFYKTANSTYTYTTFWPNNDSGTSIYNLKVAEHKDYNTTGNHWGTARGKQAESGSLIQKSQNFGPTTEGWYTLIINMDEEKDIHTYQWTAINEPTDVYTEISIVGNGINEKMTECAKAKHNWYLLNYTLSAQTTLKFNGGTKEWGGNGSKPINLVDYTIPKGDQEITVPAGTYDFYLNDITGDWSIITVE